MASLLKRIDLLQRNKFLGSISSDRNAIIKLQLEVLPDTVASIMEPAVVVTKKVSVEDVLQLIKRDTQKEEFYLYVVDLEGVFLGIVRPKELVLADQNDLVENLMITDIQNFLKDIPIESILQHPAWHEFQEIPVTDSSGQLLGKLPHRNLMKFSNPPDASSRNEIAETGSAMGELYRIGIAGLLQGGGK